MNIATIMGKIKNVPKITKNEEGKEEVLDIPAFLRRDVDGDDE